MRTRSRTLMALAAFAVIPLMHVAIQAQTARSTGSAASTYSAPRTPWGDPDLQGNYTNTYENGTPLERPDQFAGRKLEDITGEELATLRRNIQQRTIANFEGPIHAPDHWWQDNLDLHRGGQAWLVVDPPDGKIPPRTQEAQTRTAERAAARKKSGRGPADSYEDRSLYDRCITRGLPGSMMPAIYGNQYQIVQAPGYVAILYEMIHETRVIPLDGRPAIGKAIDQDMGDARGRWEGDTLVVETTELQGAQRVQQRECRDAHADRALHADQSRQGSLERDGRRSDDVDEAVDVLDAADRGRQAIPDLRVSRRELRLAEHPERGARGGAGRGGSS